MKKDRRNRHHNVRLILYSFICSRRRAAKRWLESDDVVSLTTTHKINSRKKYVSETGKKELGEDNSKDGVFRKPNLYDCQNERKKERKSCRFFRLPAYSSYSLFSLFLFRHSFVFFPLITSQIFVRLFCFVAVFFLLLRFVFSFCASASA